MICCSAIAFERHLREVQAAERVGDVEAVDVVLVLGDRRAAERRQVAERGVAADGAGASSATEVVSRGTGILAICSAVRMVVDSTEETSIGIDRAGADHGDATQVGGAIGAAAGTGN